MFFFLKKIAKYIFPKNLKFYLLFYGFVFYANYLISTVWIWQKIYIEFVLHKIRNVLNTSILKISINEIKSLKKCF